jgi:hypothetical protein
MCYGWEVWTINKRIQSQLEAAEMWFLRRMMKGPWTAKTSNKIILMRENKTQTLIKDIRKRESHFFGQFIRKEPIVLTVITGKRDRGDNERRFWMVWQFGWGRSQSRK